MKALVILIACLVTALPALAGPRLGIVLMHGKLGVPEHVALLADTLTERGHLVVTPDMPWSRARRYDKSLEDSHPEIDQWVAALREMGAERIVVGGHSMGANMAMAYAATHPGVDAVLAIGPGQTVEAESFAGRLGDSVARARLLVAEGRGDVAAAFTDLHLGKTSTVTLPARIYASYFDPAGLANMPANAPRLGMPLLWVVGLQDRNMLERGRAYVFDRLPANPANRYAEVPADHMGTPDAATLAVADWLDATFGL